MQGKKGGKHGDNRTVHEEGGINQSIYGNKLET